MFSAASPLRDPLFVLQWQVHLVTVSLFAVFGVWWGTTRRPWYLPAAIFFGLLWLFVPLEAGEPAVVLLVCTPILALVSRGLRRFLEVGPAGEADGSKVGESLQLALEANDSLAVVPRQRFRFGLRDALWLMLLFGVAFAFVVQIRKYPWVHHELTLNAIVVHWPDTALNAVCVMVLAIAGWIVARQQTPARLLIAGATGLFLVMVATAAHLVLVDHGFLLLANWAGYVANLRAAPGQFEWGPTPADILLIYLLSFLQLLVTAFLGAAVLLQRSRRVSWPTRVFINVVCSFLFGTIFLELGLVYFAILNRPDWPAETFPAENRRDELFAILKSHEALNPNSLSIDQLRRTSEETANRVAALFDELDELLEGDNITLFDSRSDVPDGSGRSMTYILEAQNLSRALLEQASSDWAAGKRAEAVRLYVLALRLAEVLQRRSETVDVLIGTSVESSTYWKLSAIRSEITCAEAKIVLPVLEKLESNREPIDLAVRRASVFDEEAYGWRTRLEAAARRLLRRPSSRMGYYHMLPRDVQLALLKADLAIRCYREQHSKWPESLEALVPDHLSTVPLDPHSQQPLVYRVEGDAFLLYSVGWDGQDDGGKLGTESDWRAGVLGGRDDSAAGVDLDLDALTRPDP